LKRVMTVTTVMTVMTVTFQTEMFGTKENSVAARVSAVLASAPVKCIKAVLVARAINWEGMSEKSELMSLLSNS
jgi:hypothetical protein